MALTDNLAAYWKMDESSGNPADSSGAGLTLTNYNTVGFSAGKISNSANFGSTNSDKYLSVASDAGITGGAFSVSFWVNVSTAPSGSYMQFFQMVDDGTDTGPLIYYSDSGGTKTLAFGRNRWGVAGVYATVNTDLGTSTWKHLIETYDTSNIRGYVNGSLVAGPTAASGVGGGSNPDNVTIGQYIDGGSSQGWWLQGLVDEVGIWSRVITADEIASLYNGGAGLTYPFSSGGATLAAKRTLLGVGI